MVQIFHGGSGPGINTVPDMLVSPATPGIPGDVFADTSFGAALACGNFDGDGFADLAIGAPTQWIPITPAAASSRPARSRFSTAARAVSIRRSQSGSTRTSRGVENEGATNDRFGVSLAVGDFFGDGGDDVAVGVREDGTGAVQLFDGSWQAPESWSSKTPTSPRQPSERIQSRNDWIGLFARQR